MLEVRNLDVKYGDLQALWSISLKVNENEIVAIVGANGAGKSTLLKTIAGLLTPINGDIIFFDEKIGRLPAYEVIKKGIALVPERRELFGNLTAYENLLMGAYTLNKDEVNERIEFVYNYFPILRERKHQLARTLSGGEQQMLAVGRAMMSNPKLLMLDEPSLGLAPKIVTELFGLIRKLNSEGITILLVEQNVYKSLKIADRGYILSNGKIVFEDISENILKTKEILRKYYIG